MKVPLPVGTTAQTNTMQLFAAHSPRFSQLMPSRRIPWTTAAHKVERIVRYGLVSVLMIGFQQRNPSVVVNAVLALVATFLPDLIEHHYDMAFRPWQRMYAAIAMLMHAIGMVGPYDEVWWWDHLTHTHSATLLSGIVYTLSRRRGRDPRRDVVSVVVCAGTLWELMEYVIHVIANRLGFEPVLVSYGPIDTFLDLLFNLVGALLVLVFGDSALENLIDNRTSA